MDNIEVRNGVASFAENVKSGLAWHGLGKRVEGAMFVEEALKLSHADYNVSLQPIVALSPEVLTMMDNAEMISPEVLRSLIVGGAKATMRTDLNETMGLVSDKYGIVQNVEAFKFVDMFCTGMDSNRDNTPVIETCGVLGRGERVFVTAKFPKAIVLDAKRDDLIDMYMTFTTSHDGSGAVRAMVTPIRVVCNNTLNMAMKNNIGRISFRHTANVMNRMDLLNTENAKFAYKALNVFEVYQTELQQRLEHLKNIKLSERDLDNILAEVLLPEESAKLFLDTRNINAEEISSKSRNVFLNVKANMESGVGQDILESGTALWALNGLTSYFQNKANFKNDEAKFDSLMDGNAYNKVNKAYNLLLAV